MAHHNDNLAQRALELEKNGIMGMDTLHVASVEEAGADYFTHSNGFGGPCL